MWVWIRRIVLDVVNYIINLIRLIGEKELFTYSAAIAYFTIVAAPPLIVLVTHFWSQAADPDMVYNLLYGELQKLIGETGTDRIRGVVDNLMQYPLSPFLKTIGLIAILFSCTTIFMTMKIALNRIFIGKPRAKKGFWQAVQTRFLGLAMILGFLFVLISSFLVNTIISYFLDLINTLGDFDVSQGAIILAYVVPLVVLACIFALLFRILPDHKIPWRYALLGGFITSTLFTIGKDLISYYIGRSELIGLLDAAGSIIVVTIWLYYASIIFFVGALITETTLKEDERQKAKQINV